MDSNVELSKTEKSLRKKLGSVDMVYHKTTIGKFPALFVFADSVTDKEALSKDVLPALSKVKTKNPIKLCHKLPFASMSVVFSENDAVTEILSGKTVAFFEGERAAISIDLKKVEARAVAEPPTSAVTKGPREGFTDNARTNLSMIRRRLKTEYLTLEEFSVGRLSKTQVTICYLSNIADDSIVKVLRERIKKIDIDSVADSSYIAKLIVERKASLFKQVGNTEKSDVLCAKLMEGRIGIIVDGSPIAITVPYMLIEDFQSSEDYFQNNYHANLARIIRVISIMFAVLLPAIFVSAQLFHLQVIPLNFLLTIVNSIKGIPLSPSAEMFFTLLVFEILNEASIRMPKYVGMALSVVGALVLGDTAVRAGIVSTPTIMIMALSGIALYTVPELVDSLAVLRLIFLFVGGSFGGYGIVLTLCYILVYLCSLENFDVPALAPYAPLEPADLKDGVYMGFLQDMRRRPSSLKPKNKIRMKSDD
ncbi:MAG: spore germination protein [Clostridia bacterium]|nr:spore germination protein [Clostridia bacterium]